MNALKLLFTFALFNTLFVPEGKANELAKLERDVAMAQLESYSAISTGYFVPYFSLPELGLPFIHYVKSDSSFAFSISLAHRSPVQLTQTRLHGLTVMSLTDQMHMWQSATLVSYRGIESSHTGLSFSFGATFNASNNTSVHLLADNILKLGADVQLLPSSYEAISLVARHNFSPLLRADIGLGFDVQSTAGLFVELEYAPLAGVVCTMAGHSARTELCVSVLTEVSQMLALSWQYKTQTISDGMAIGVHFAFDAS